MLVTHFPAHCLVGPPVNTQTGFASAPPFGDIRWLDAATFNRDLGFFGPHLDLAVNGHSARSLDVQVDGTRVVQNPKGAGPYRGACENEQFDPDLKIEI